MKDAYSILGVNKTASQEEIKKAYRKLSLQYHPDKNSDPSAAERFKEIASAYELIDSEEKRKKYDRKGFTSFDFGFDNFDRSWSQRFDETFGGGFRTKRRVNVQVTVSLEDAYYGLAKQIQLISGSYTLIIPAGINTGATILVDSTSTEDIYALINVSKDPKINREGNDLYTSVEIDIFDLILGGEVSINIFKSRYKIMIKPSTQPGTTLRLREKGMPILNFPENKGNLFVELIAKIPDLTDEQVDIVRNLKNDISNK
jgi:curved DNA-binding protein